MRVLLWGELFWPYIGGAEIFAADLMRSLRGRGYEFVVVTSHDFRQLADEDEFQGIPIHRFPFRSALSPAHVDELLTLKRRVVTLLRTWAPQVIHVNGVSPSVFFCLQALKTERVPLLVRLNRELRPHQSPETRGTLLEHALRRADWVTSVSTAILQQALQIVPDISTRATVIYNGVDAPAAPPDAAVHLAPRPLAPRLLCLGRLVHDKGFDLAIDGFASIRHRWPHVRMTIAGDGPARVALEQQVRARGAAEAIEFVGMVAPDAVPRLMADATMLLLPSREDGLPNVALQGAAMGRPIISTRTGGLPEVVRHGETGLLVDATSTAVAEGITMLLEHPADAQQMGRNGWRHVREVFSRERCVDAYDALYRSLAGAPQ